MLVGPRELPAAALRGSSSPLPLSPRRLRPVAREPQS